MNHLNYFHPYNSKEADHEDQLTRAYLVILKYSPQAMAAFYSYCLAKYQENKCDAPELQLPYYHQLQTAEIHIETQRTNTVFKANQLLSVLITDAELEKQPEQIKASKRNARYDGIIQFDEELTLIIENKPSSAHVWLDQLNPAQKSMKDEVVILPKPACLEWKEIIRQLNSLLNAKAVTGAEKLIIEDFLSYIDRRYPVLNPYDSFALCKGNQTLLERRIKNVLENIAGDAFEINHHRGWGYYIPLNFPSIKMAGLILHKKKNSWYLELSLYFGIGVEQARNFYKKSIDLDKISDPNLEIQTHFRLSFRSQGLVWFPRITGPNEVSTYISYWKKNPGDIRQVKREELDNYLHKLEAAGVIKINQKVEDALNEKFRNTKMQSLNAGPGLGLIYTIDAEEAIQWDHEKIFEEKIKTFLRQGLSIINRVPEQFMNKSLKVD